MIRKTLISLAALISLGYSAICDNVDFINFPSNDMTESYIIRAKSTIEHLKQNITEDITSIHQQLPIVFNYGTHENEKIAVYFEFLINQERCVVKYQGYISKADFEASKNQMKEGLSNVES